MPIRVRQETAATATSLPWIPLNIHNMDAPTTFVVNKGVNFARTFQVQFTVDDIFDADVSAFPVTAFEAVDVTSGVLDQPMTAIRLRVVLGSGSATTSFRVLQGGV